jgi:hypothetical protein
MSRAYRVSVKESQNRVIRAEDHVSRWTRAAEP